MSLVIPSNASPIASIIGVDPGSNCLGVGIIYYDVITLEIVGSDAFTLFADKLAKNSWTGFVHGGRAGRIEALGETLLKVMHDQTGLTDVISESPFMSRFAQTFAALTEVVNEVRFAVTRYHPWMPLHLVDPPSVKNAVGAKGNADKDAVKLALRMLEGFVYTGGIPFGDLDEHSVDALAVGYFRYKQLKEMNQWQSQIKLGTF